MLIIRSMTHVITLPLLAAILLMFPLSCGDDNESGDPWPSVSKSDTYSAAGGDQVFLVDTTGNVNLTYTLYLGAATRDVYFIFTNTTMSDADSNPVVKNMGEEEPLPDDAIMSDEPVSTSIVELHDAGTSPPGQRGTPEISEFNKNPFKTTNEILELYSLHNMISTPAPLFYSIGQTVPFYFNTTSTTFDSRYSYSKTAHGKILNVWVENRISAAGTDSITDAEAQSIGNKFLNDALPSDDIYEWVSNIFGAEWGNHSYDELISSDNVIHILIYDFAYYDTDMTNVIGFFWAKDNFKSSYYNNSNQKIMFYINSSFVNSDIEEVYSTLAHEFQHMINFYQKNVLRVPNGDGPETWINEMCSMAAEDFVSKKLQVDGPRGISWSDKTDGTPTISTDGRLPRYNYFNYISLVKWLTTYPAVLNSYSINYAFGSYLARNFGGAPFFRKIVQNEYTDYQSINYALTQSGYSEDFSSVLRKWAAANLLSDNTNPPAEFFQYNSGTWFSSSIDGITYDLGSINLYNYYYSGQTGPRIYTSSIPYGKEAASNVYYRVGSNLTGIVTRTITMEDNIKLTVVVKE